MSTKQLYTWIVLLLYIMKSNKGYNSSEAQNIPKAK